MKNEKVSAVSQPPVTFDLSLRESACSRSPDWVVRQPPAERPSAESENFPISSPFSDRTLALASSRGRLERQTKPKRQIPKTAACEYRRRTVLRLQPTSPRTTANNPPVLKAIWSTIVAGAQTRSGIFWRISGSFMLANVERVIDEFHGIRIGVFAQLLPPKALRAFGQINDHSRSLSPIVCPVKREGVAACFWK